MNRYPAILVYLLIILIIVGDGILSIGNTLYQFSMGFWNK